MHVKVTVTGPLFQSLALGPVRELKMLGGVLSILMPPTVADATFPALSVHVALRDWFAPSVETICGLTGPAFTPERASVQMNETVTLALFQPFELAEGDLEPVRTGSV